MTAQAHLTCLVRPSSLFNPRSTCPLGCVLQGPMAPPPLHVQRRFLGPPSVGFGLAVRPWPQGPRRRAHPSTQHVPLPTPRSYDTEHPATSSRLRGQGSRKGTRCGRRPSQSSPACRPTGIALLDRGSWETLKASSPPSPLLWLQLDIAGSDAHQAAWRTGVAVKFSAALWGPARGLGATGRPGPDRGVCPTGSRSACCQGFVRLAVFD
jgi:hypothetical protein